MTLWFHSTIIATSLAATVAVGLASASMYARAPAAKADRLPVVTDQSASYLTVEARTDGVSILKRVPTVGAH